MRTALIYLLPLVALLMSGVQASRAAEEQSSVKQIDALISSVTKPTEPGLAVLVKKDGKVTFEKGYGMRQLGGAAKITPETNFRLASVSKQFTAMSIMLLVHDGKLHYDDRLTDIWPDFPAYGRAITIRHLLTHTSGLPDYEGLMEKAEAAGAPRWTATRQIQNDEVLALLKKAKSGKFAPGTSWEYSNSGFVVLAQIVEKVSGMPFRDFVERRIFAPLQMAHSVVYQKGINEIRDRAYGHSKAKRRLVRTDQSSTSATLGDGGIYSNLEDLAKWDEALQSRTLLSEQDMAPALVPVKLNNGSEPHWPTKGDSDNLEPGKPVSYGYGWFLNPYQGHARMWHSGTTMGFRLVVQRFTADHLTIIVLCNRMDCDASTLAPKIAELIFAGKW